MRQPVTFSDSASRISEVQAVREERGALEIRTRTSVYRLVQEGPQRAERSIEWDDIASVMTARGSTYTYLPNGKTQRFKEVTKQLEEPQDLLVYVPNYAWLMQHAPEQVRNRIGENELIYHDTLLEHVHSIAGRKAYMQGADGTELLTTEQIRSASSMPGLGFYRNGAIEFFIPVSLIPKIGWQTYDQRVCHDAKTGDRIRERHLGNKVVKITLKDGTVIE